MSLYTDLVDAGIETSNRYSDLYFPVSQESAEILAKHPKQKGIALRFKSNTDGKQTYEVPFAFDPYWEKKLEKDEPDVSHL